MLIAACTQDGSQQRRRALWAGYGWADLIGKRRWGEADGVCDKGERASGLFVWRKDSIHRRRRLAVVVSVSETSSGRPGSS